MSSVNLTPEQEDVIYNMHVLINDPDNNFMVVDGSAGTGKTTVISEIRNSLQTMSDMVGENFDFHLCATTNKAVEVLASSVQCEVSTIFSLLGIRIHPEYKTPIFPKLGKIKIANALVVVDEYSYISQDLLDFLLEIAHPLGLKFVFFGDECQLAPVKHTYIPVADEGFLTVKLTKLLRQKSEDMQEINDKLKQFVIDNVFPTGLLSQTDNVRIYSVDEGDLFFTNLLTALENGNAKFVSYTNKRVSAVNKELFKFIKQRTNFAKGDVLINNKYKMLSKDCTVKTEQSIIVSSARDAQFVLEAEEGFNKAHAVTGQWIKSSSLSKEVFVPNSPNLFKLQDSPAITTYSRKKIENEWLDLRPEYACTVHKSQGSTYSEVFLDLSDFSFVKDKELSRLLYVALTRSKDKIHIFGEL